MRWETFIDFGVLVERGLVWIEFAQVYLVVLAIPELLLAVLPFFPKEAVVKLHAFGIEVHLHSRLELFFDVLGIQSLVRCLRLMICRLDDLDRSKLRDLTH